MKLSEYVISFIENKVSDSIFLLSGGGIMHLVDSIGRAKKLQYYCCHHEQAAAIAAEGYARTTNTIGVVCVTTGPGGTNAITGVAGAWLDSIPMLVITGQVKTDNIMPRKNGVPMIRELGFQELNIIDLIKPITKYAVMLEEPWMIRYHLEKAIYLAKHGRPGPVWIDIPLDLQAVEIDPEKLPSFIPMAETLIETPRIPMEMIVEKLNKAKRPMLLVGNGIRLAGAEKEMEQFLKKTNINTATTIFTSDDLVTYEYPRYLGRQGMPGNYEANYAIDNCDVLLVIGERMQLTQVSYDYQKFATQACKIMVDVDESELFKKTLAIDIPVWSDAKLFLEELNKQKIKINTWNIESVPIDTKSLTPAPKYINVYELMHEMNKYMKPGLHITTANGTASLIPHQALKVVKGQRFLTNAGLGHMGSGLPLAIGACVANKKKPVICMEGDGSLMLNIQELQTMIYHKLPIKLFIYNNNGYYSIRNTHTNYFKKIVASDPESGVSFPDFSQLIPAWGLPYVRIEKQEDLPKLQEVFDYTGAIVCELIIDPAQPCLPKWTAGQYRGTINK